MTPRTRIWVRNFVDYSPLAVFLVAYFATGRNITTATWALVVGSGIALLVGLIVERRIAPLPAIAGGAALVFGGASLFFHDPRILKMKPTVMNGLFAVGLLGGMAFGKNPLRLMLGEAFDMPPQTWRQLTINYAVFFLVLAILNEIIWRSTEKNDDIWVLYRFPGMMILTFAFSIAHAPLLMKHVKQDDPPPSS
jgi:intracellular septation protein